MEKIHRKIKFSDVEGDDIFFNIFLSQTIENIGIFTDTIEDPKTIPTEVTSIEDLIYPENKNVSSYVSQPMTITYQTSSRLDELIPYSNTNSISVGTLIEERSIVDYMGNQKATGDLVTNIFDGVYEYVFDGTMNGNTVINSSVGFRYVTDMEKTTITYETQGNNFTNSSFSNIIKEDHLMGIIDVLETKSDIFINRGQISAYEAMLRIGDVNNITQLTNYGNGVFNIIEQ